MKKIKYIVAIVLVLIVAGFLVTRNSSQTPGTTSSDSQTAQVEIKGVQIPVELARTESEQEKGLSNRASLEASSGMLFIFVEKQEASFWMPDMSFPIDIIWINNGKVVGIDADVAPETNLEEPTIYDSPEPVTHVLEVNAGFAKNKNIMIGDTVTFKNIE